MTSSSNTRPSDAQGSNAQPDPAPATGRTSPPPSQIQGEGNYDAAREFDEAERKFVESGKVEAAARAAAPRTEAEQQEMLDAERKGKSRAKEEDPALRKK